MFIIIRIKLRIILFFLYKLNIVLLMCFFEIFEEKIVNFDS